MKNKEKIRNGKPYKTRPFGIYKIRTRKKLKDLIEEFFRICEETKEPPTLTGLALHLGVSRQIVYTYSKTEEYGDLIENARDRCIHFVEKGMLRNKLNSVASIFYLKNNSSYRDKVEQDITSKGEKIGGLVGILNELDGHSKKLEIEKS